ncbi:MAG: GH3 auxin-responsive promoter family protein [Planctomycetes bacterium]|nr:GH3 auxin-responsive promoter family protein [Planctomycetota bacterium]
MLGWLFRNLLVKILSWPMRRRLAAFEAASENPAAVQSELLQGILARQASTAFGKDHGFAKIHTLADFRNAIPVRGYDYVEPYMQRVLKGETTALLADQTIHMFAMTSGTTATRKFIPVTDQYLDDYKRGWNLWGLRVYRDHPEVRLRPIVQMSGDWQEFTTETGIPCGAVTGLTAQMQMWIIRWIYCVPAIVGKVKDPAAKYYLALRLSIPRHAGMIIAANPSTLVNLARTGDAEKESLLRDIHDGTLSDRFDIPADVRYELSGKIATSDPARVKELEEIIRRTGTLYPKDYWPTECIIGNWMGGSVGAYLRHFPKYYGNTPVRDVGLIASEGRMTIPMDDGTPSGVLDVTSHFFEFIPEEEGDSQNPTVLAAHELQEGKSYYILMTTAYGLYRYNIFDVVRCTGFFNKTPLVEFLSKGAHFANITGEKVSEHQVTAAMAEVLREMNLNLTAFSVAPCWDDEMPYYGLFIEGPDLANREQAIHLTRLMEERLARINIEYASKRESQRLGPMRLFLLPAQFWQQWDRQRLARTGGALDQYKHPCLIADAKFRDSVTIVEEVRVPVGT